MIYRCLYVVFPVAVLFSGCATGTGSDGNSLTPGEWQETGLQERSINTLNSVNGFLYSATDSGLYRKTLEAKPDSWASIGLQDYKVLNIVFLPGNKWLAAVRISYFSRGIPSLYLSTDNGTNWQTYMNNFGGENGIYTWVESIATTSIPSDTIFTSASGLVARSIDGGNTWEAVNGDWDYWGGAEVLVKADPYYKQRIWTGGVNAYSLPDLLKSTDAGETWENLKSVGTTEQVCYDIVSHPQDNDMVLAGFAGSLGSSLQIRKSIDGGDSWQRVHEGTGTYTMTNSIRNPETVYASGRNADGTIFFLVSTDFGDHWKMITLEEGPTKVQVNDLVSVMLDGQEVLYFGTNKGVYSYTFEK